MADIFRLYGKHYRNNHALFICTELRSCIISKYAGPPNLAAMSSNVTRCGFERNAYNSCRDRHCPKCQTLAKEQWLNDRKAELLPCGYFHLVFTLPHDLNPIILCNKRVTLQILFTAVSETLQAFAKDPQWRLEGKLGFIAVLHTWSQTLMDHFHLHCLIPAGALSFKKDRWIPARRVISCSELILWQKSLENAICDNLETAYLKEELIFPGNTAPV